ncbi:hypothetical protein F7734_10005 [Scytonema sp. UIC 10036]|uniref:hypothetical protein n=1 Tax=Scytonema sp. UIC 10036 TaxID=2304196 RepID=UPI0012DABBC3|nr:hypothetical protein [Scytonema sp. UIC 10036]MUG92764.1 hypothetical protein [Scytonema sp. UIC 10036]
MNVFSWIRQKVGLAKGRNSTKPSPKTLLLLLGYGLVFFSGLVVGNLQTQAQMQRQGQTQVNSCNFIQMTNPTPQPAVDTRVTTNPTPQAPPQVKQSPIPKREVKD